MVRGAREGFAGHQTKENTAVIRIRDTVGQYSVHCATKWLWVISARVPGHMLPPAHCHMSNPGNTLITFLRMGRCLGKLPIFHPSNLERRCHTLRQFHTYYPTAYQAFSCHWILNPYNPLLSLPPVPRRILVGLCHSIWWNKTQAAKGGAGILLIQTKLCKFSQAKDLGVSLLT